MIPWLVLIALIIVYSLTLPKLLERAGLSSALGYIPIVNFIPFLKMIKRPWWWFLLLLCPGVNLMMMVIINVELGIAFGKRSTTQQWFFGACPWYALYKLAYQEKEVAYIGPRDWTGKKKSFGREWGEAIVFAVVAASVIRTFFIEAFTIPTPSMEKTMLVGDYLFVSKMSYGAKIPQTPMSVPFVHNAMPGSMTNSYVDWFSLPYFRLPGFGKVDRMDPVVFNFPNGDTIMVDPYYAGHDYYSYLRKEAMFVAGGYDKYKTSPEKFLQTARDNFSKKNLCRICGAEKFRMMGKPWPIGGLRARPMDKKENYVKRCVGLPGDELSIVNRQLMINGQPAENPAGLMYSYTVTAVSEEALKRIYRDYKVNKNDQNRIAPSVTHTSFTYEDYEKLKSSKDVVSIEINNDTLPDEPLAYYPNVDMAPFNSWTKDNYGPIHIPAEGETIQLTPENIALYKRVITAYEGNKLDVKDGQAFINDQPATSYTFRQNYYWMMGDNRHQSADSRYWGFVPEDHIVGKPVFTWFSKSNPDYQDDTSIRWNRMFRFVR